MRLCARLAPAMAKTSPPRNSLLTGAARSSVRYSCTVTRCLAGIAILSSTAAASLRQQFLPAFHVEQPLAQLLQSLDRRDAFQPRPQLRGRRSEALLALSQQDRPRFFHASSSHNRLISHRL